MKRIALVLAPLIGIALATAGQAAPTTVPQVKDALGDSTTRQAAQDIASVLWTTAGSGKGKAYVPKQLVVTLTMAGPIDTTTPVFTYEVEALSSACGVVTFTYEPGTPYESVTGLNGWADWGDCANTAGDGSIELLTPKIKGSTITWTFSLKAIEVKPGTTLSAFAARVDPANPVVPFPSSTFGTELGLVDAATGTGTYKVG